jgi:hypothetical protein
LSGNSSNVAPQLNHAEVRNLIAQDRFSRQFEKGNLHSQQSPDPGCAAEPEILNL